jgi:hypothetical protein
MHRVIVSLALLVGQPALADPAASVGFRGCGTHDEVTGWLERQFGEAPLVSGRQGDGHLLEIFAAKSGDSWTVVVTDPDGESCITSEGIELELVRPFPGDQPVA